MQSIVGITIGQKKCQRNCIWFKKEILTQENMCFYSMYLGLQNQWPVGCIVMSLGMVLGYGFSELR